MVPGERALPTPKPNEVLIKVAAAGVNRPDVLQRQGLYAVPPDASDLPGLEIAGEVVACGAKATRWKIGDMLERLNLRTAPRPRLYRHSIKHIDQLLFQTGLQKVRGATLGFGPFTFLKRKLLAEHVGIVLHRRLQTLADRQWPGIRSLGTEYVVMARKSQTA